MYLMDSYFSVFTDFEQLYFDTIKLLTCTKHCLVTQVLSPVHNQFFMFQELAQYEVILSHVAVVLQNLCTNLMCLFCMIT